MTSLSRRKRRTTARRTTPLTLAASAAALVALCAATGLAQQPGYSPAGQPPGALPLPPGYRPRTPPPAAQPRPAPAPGSAGTVMYFQKRADALVATGGPGSSSAGAEGAVAQVSDPVRVPVAGLPDVPASSLPPLPPPPPESRYLAPPLQAPPLQAPPLQAPPLQVVVPQEGAPTAQGFAVPQGNPAPQLAAASTPPAVTLPSTTAVPFAQPQPPAVQPAPGTQPKAGEQDPAPPGVRRQPIPSVPENEIRLPPRQSIFGIVYDDPQLERAIMERLRTDLKKEKKYSPDQERYLVFPPLPVISPAGVAYQPKTSQYPPSQAVLEPGFVVHRRLHFEERNAERYGWDLGPLQTLVSAAYFFGDVLTWPHSLASGCASGFWSTSAGKCAPGSPVPYYLYPPKITASGTAFETLIVATTAIAIFP